MQPLFRSRFLLKLHHPKKLSHAPSQPINSCTKGNQHSDFEQHHSCVLPLFELKSWAPKNWCFWTVVLEKTLESPLNCKKIKQVNPKGNQSWIFIGRTDAEAETLNTLSIWCKELTHWKRLWCWARLRAGEGGDRGWVVRWHHWLSGHEFEQTPRDSKGQGSLACCNPWGRKE